MQSKPLFVPLDQILGRCSVPEGLYFCELTGARLQPARSKTGAAATGGKADVDDAVPEDAAEALVDEFDHPEDDFGDDMGVDCEYAGGGQDGKGQAYMAGLAWIALGRAWRLALTSTRGFRPSVVRSSRGGTATLDHSAALRLARWPAWIAGRSDTLGSLPPIPTRARAQNCAACSVRR